MYYNTVITSCTWTLCRDRIFTMPSRWYHTVPYPFRSPFLVTIDLLPLHYRVITHFMSLILLRSFPLENTSTVDWLSNSIQLLGIFDLSWFEHSASWCCRNAKPSYSSYSSLVSASVSVSSSSLLPSVISSVSLSSLVFIGTCCMVFFFYLVYCFLELCFHQICHALLF